MKFKEKLDRLMNEKTSNNEFSGVVLIMKDDTELFSGAYGYANKAFKVRNRLDTRFRVASITKMFTAASILQLIEEGKLDFDTKIVKYLGLEDTKLPEEVNLYHLLTHTSGIADYFDEMNSEEEDWEKLWKEKPIYNMRQLSDYFDMFAYEEPVSKPGEKFQYNGAGYILLGMAIEKASGMSYFDYVREKLFAKINMEGSDFIPLDRVEEKVAEGYEAIEDAKGDVTGWIRNIYLATANAASDGGSISTAKDLIRFIQALKNHELLSRSMTEKFFMPHEPIEQYNGIRDYKWMYGFANYFILDDKDTIVRGGHTGEEAGISSRLYYYPKLNIEVAILGNQGWCSGGLAWEIHDMILEENL